MFGGELCRPSELEALLTEAQQFLWGPAEVSCGSEAPLQRLQAAKAWATQVPYVAISAPNSSTICIPSTLLQALFC